jgi:hypothetical protein
MYDAGGYFESDFAGRNKKASRPKRAIEMTASHHGWKTTGKRMTKAMNTAHRHVDESLIYAALSALHHS